MTYSISGTSNSRRQIYPSPGEAGEHPKYAKAKNTQGSETVPRADRVL